MNKAAIVIISLILAIGLVGCITISPPPAVPPAPAPPAPALPAPAPEAPTPKPTPAEEPEPTLEPEPQPMPINIRLDYIGVKCAHGGNVQLVVVVGDEDKDKMEKYLFPPVEEGYPMGDCLTASPVLVLGYANT